MRGFYIHEVQCSRGLPIPVMAQVKPMLTRVAPSL